MIFPVLHGTFGEDGTIQGLLELADIPYVGAGVLGSAAGMDKDIMKSLFIAAGIPIVKHVTILRGAWENDPKKVQKLVESKLNYPVFVKPANLGSSVGISKAHNRKELGPAIEEAAKFDRKIVIEQGVGGKKEKAREIECSVLGNDEPAASVPGEIVPGKEFYDYTAKYVDEGSQLIIPAKLTKAETKKVQELGDCSVSGRGLFWPGARGFPDGSEDAERFILNEINTMPGFTAISMYPKLWAASGLAYADLIDRLIQLGIERHEDKKKNQYSRVSRRLLIVDLGDSDCKSSAAAYYFPASHTKFAASFVSPLPLYFAACGYAHSGRVIFGCCLSSPAYFEAMIVPGAVPFSTHCSRARIHAVLRIVESQLADLPERVRARPTVAVLHARHHVEAHERIRVAAVPSSR